MMLKLDAIEDSKSVDGPVYQPLDKADGEDCATADPRQAAASQSSNSENGDHTYNPYSFKRLQDAIFRKKDGHGMRLDEQPGAALEKSAHFMPMQRPARLFGKHGGVCAQKIRHRLGLRQRSFASWAYPF